MTLQKQVERGIELAFCSLYGPDFGPLVMVSPDGILVDLFDERQFALAPFSPQQAVTMIRKLTVARLIEGARGKAPRDLRVAALALSAFSIASASLGSGAAEIETNPVVVTECGAIAVDALIVPAGTAAREAA